MKILAIDPGKNIGTAWRFDDGKFDTTTLHLPQHLWDMIYNLKPSVLVIERFITQGRVNEYMTDTIEIVGGVRAACHLLNIPLVTHVPQNRYPFLKEADRLLRLGKKLFTIHEKDALSHLLCHEWVEANPTAVIRSR